jgi:Leucine-rich repeat (LRR) protein/tRNA A-37 threonylcarbamoyl transferase component Bud32
MAVVASCPDRDVLERLMLGRIAGPEGELLAQHLEGCERCSAAVLTLGAEDTLTEATRGPSTAEGGPDADVVRGLVESLRRLGPPAAAGQTTADETPNPEHADGGEDAYDFLAPPQAPDEIGRLGVYRVLKVLGSGGMGVVFQAEDVHLRRTVALKVMRPEAARKPRARERFLREARAAAALEHEHVVTIYQVGEERGVPFLTMQWLKGMTLEEHLRRSGTLHVSEVPRLGRQIARGLAAAHARGLVHRDIKPANVWLEALPDEPGGLPPRYRVKILDFGLARAADDDANLTQSGTVVGTPSHMAPEQARGEKVDSRCDLFSLGVVLYRLCTGRLPFGGKNTMAVLSALATDTPKPVGDLNPAVPAGLAELVMQLLAKHPVDRPGSAREVADRLQAIEQAAARAAEPSPTKAAPPAPAPTPAARPMARRRWALVAAALVLLALLPPAYFFGGQVIRIATNRGQLVIEVDDPKVEVTVKENGAVIQDRPGQREITLAAGEHEFEVAIKDAAGEHHFFTRKLTLKRGGKEIIDVAQELAVQPAPPAPKKDVPAPPPPPKEPADAERQAALWALSGRIRLGVRVGNSDIGIDDAKDLPAGDWHVVCVILNNNPVGAARLEHLKPLTKLERLDLKQAINDDELAQIEPLTSLLVLQLSGSPVSDAGLVHLQKLTNLSVLFLNGTKVTDAGLERLKPLTNLGVLFLESTKVSDAGLIHLKPLARLGELDLGSTQVGDDGMVYLKPLTKLSVLHLYNTRVGDRGLEQLGTQTNLQGLHLSGTQISDVGLEHLKTLTNLLNLDVGDSRIGDDGLVHLKALTNLRILSLGHTRVTDAGLDHLVHLQKLERLNLQGTRVSRKKVEALRKMLPNLSSDHLLWWEPNRKAAEAVLALGGTVHIRRRGDADDRLVKDRAELPDDYFQLTQASLAGVKKADPGLLPKLAALSDPEFDHFVALDLSDSIAGNANLPGLNRGLEELSLARTQVDDLGLEGLKGMTKLRRLVFDGSAIRGTGLAHLKELPALAELHLDCPTIADLSLPLVGDLKHLEKLSLRSSGVTDEGLKSLHGLSGLQELDLTETKVTAEGVAALQKALPKCRITGPGAK